MDNERELLELLIKSTFDVHSQCLSTMPNEGAMPIIVAEEDDGSINVINLAVSEEAMPSVIRAIRHDFAEKNVQRYVYASEAWVATLDLKTADQKTLNKFLADGDTHKIDERPDRQEALVIVAVNKSPRFVICRSWPIIRTEGAVRLGEPYDMDGEGIGGRLTTLL